MLRCSIIGNLGADAVVKRGDFKQFVSLNLAHTRRFKVDGQVNEETIWVNVTINWDCSNLLLYLVKGTKVYASGSLRLRSFKGNDGNWHAGATIIADTVELCGSSRPDTHIPEDQTDKATNNAPFL